MKNIGEDPIFRKYIEECTFKKRTKEQAVSSVGTFYGYLKDRKKGFEETLKNTNEWHDLVSNYLEEQIKYHEDKKWKTFTTKMGCVRRYFNWILKVFKEESIQKNAILFLEKTKSSYDKSLSPKNKKRERDDSSSILVSESKDESKKVKLETIVHIDLIAEEEEIEKKKEQFEFFPCSSSTEIRSPQKKFSIPELLMMFDGNNYLIPALRNKKTGKIYKCLPKI